MKIQLGPRFWENCLFNHRCGLYFQLIFPSIISYYMSPSALKIASAGPSSLYSCKSQPGLSTQAQLTLRGASSNISTATVFVSRQPRSQCCAAVRGVQLPQSPSQRIRFLRSHRNRFSSLGVRTNGTFRYGGDAS